MQPVSRIFRHNERNVSAFEIAAVGTGHIHHLWQKYDQYSNSWTPVSSRTLNDTSPNLNFSIITEEDQGIYHCIVTNYDGSVISDNVTITVFGMYVCYAQRSKIKFKFLTDNLKVNFKIRHVHLFIKTLHVFIICLYILT